MYSINTPKQHSVTQTSIPMKPPASAMAFTPTNKAKSLLEPEPERKLEEEPELEARDLLTQAPAAQHPFDMSSMSSMSNLVTPSPPAPSRAESRLLKRHMMAKKSEARMHPSEFIDNLDDVKAFEDGMDDDLTSRLYGFFVDKAAGARSSIDFECASSDVGSASAELVPLDMCYGMKHVVDDALAIKSAEPATPKVFESVAPAQAPATTTVTSMDTKTDASQATETEVEPVASESQFEGLDVRRWQDWEHCVEFMRRGGLVVAEVYSKVFGPSEVMFPLVADVIRRKAQSHSIQFVRLSLQSMKGIELVREAEGVSGGSARLACAPPAAAPANTMALNNAALPLRAKERHTAARATDSSHIAAHCCSE